MFLLDGKKISIERDLTIGEGDAAITHPAANLQNAEFRESIGIVEVNDPVRPDERLYYVTENLDGSYTSTPRPREQVTAPVWEQIKAKRDFHEFNGGVKVGDDWFHNDVTSKQKWDAMALKAYIDNNVNDDAYEILGQQVVWKTMAGTFVPVTADLISAVKRKFEEHVATVYVVAEQHKAAMLLLENPFEYSYLSGWPQTYQEWFDSQ